MLKLRHGDKVVWVDNQGNTHNATIVMPASIEGAWVANTGGRYGRPTIISEKNFVAFGRKKLRKVI